MDIKKKIWLSIVLVITLPIALAIWVIDDVLKQNDNATGWMVFDTNYTTSMIELREDFEDYIEKIEPIDHEAFIESLEDEAFINTDYTGALVTVNDALVFRSGLYNEKLAHDLIKEIEDENISMSFDRYVSIRIDDVDFTSGDKGVFYLIIDNDALETTSDDYWLGQILAVTLSLVTVSLVCIVWISKGLRKSVTMIKRITENLKNGKLDEPLKYNSNDEFWELAHETEQLRLSLKHSLDRQEELEEEKKKMIADISHDLRTPLTAIHGYAQAIKDGVAKSPSEKQEYLDIIQSKARSIEQLISDLKAVSDIDNKNMEYKFQSLSLTEFLKDCLDDLHYELSAVGGKMKLTSPKEDINIIADPSKLSRVFVNIIGNSIKYKSDRPLNIQILVELCENKVRIDIIDNGIGVSDNELDQIFNRFYRADKSRNSDIGGSGLGLSICADILEAHEGHIRAVPSKNQGLNLVIELPIAREGEGSYENFNR